MPTKTALYLTQFHAFQCTGSACEDTCCSGWRIDVDKNTYQHYKKNLHPALRQLFRDAVKRNKTSTDPDQYGILERTPEGSCTFLENGLCKIHATLGAASLSKICADFPRRVNHYGEHEEYSLDLSCPEAARLILLNREHLTFSDTPPTNRQVPLRANPIQFMGTHSPNQDSALVLNELRALVIVTLQHSQITLDTRLLLVGLLLESIEQEANPFNEQSIEKLPAILEKYYGMLSQAHTIEAELSTIEPNETIKLRVFRDILLMLPEGTHLRLAQCIKEAADGLSLNSELINSEDALISEHQKAFELFYAPFFIENPHILENYIVHTVFHTGFPFKSGTPLTQYRELICNYLITRICLLGMAAHHGGMTESIAVRFIQSFARHSQHNVYHTSQVLAVLKTNNLLDFRQLFLLLINRTKSKQNPVKRDLSPSGDAS